MKKRILSLILAVTLVFASFGGVVAKEKENISTAPIPIGDVVLLDEDFSKSNSLDIYGTAKRLSSDGNGYLDLSGATQRGFGKMFDEVLPKGRYCISYDFYSETTEHTTYLRLIGKDSKTLYDTNNSWITMRFESGGVSRIHRSPSYHLDRHLFGEWTAGEWHSFAAWIDLEEREIEYWYDGECIATMALMEQLYEIKGFFLHRIATVSDAKYMVDNVKITKDSDDRVGAFSPIDLKYTVAEDIVGNNFYTDNPPRFDIALKNRLSKKQSIQLYYKTIDDEGVERWRSQPETLEIGAKEEYKTEVLLDEPYYGVMKLIAVTTVDGVTHEQDIPYSISNHTSDMPLNYRSGVSAHTDRGRGDYRDALPLLNHAGIGNIRDGWIYWGTIEQTPGVYNFPQSYDDFLNLCQEYDIDYTNYFRGHGIYGQPGDSNGYPPSTEEAFKALEKFMAEVAKWADGRLFAMEVFNEYNNSGMTGPYSQRYDIFANMHKAMWNGLKSVDPNIYVAGLAEDNWSTNVMQVTGKYLEEMKGGTYFDAVATHPYVPSFDAPERGITQGLHDAMESLLIHYKYDTDMPRFGTEFGWDSANQFWNYRRQGTFFPRAMHLTLAQESLDRMFWYTFCDYPQNSVSNPQESSFGLLEGFDPLTVEVALLAKPVYVMTAYYNNLMANAEHIKSFNDEEVFSYHAKHRDGDDLLMLGAIDHTAMTRSYNLGCSKVTVGDAFGNEHTVYSKSGVYDFLLNPYDITYVKGNFKKVEDVSGINANFSISDTERYVPIDCPFEITVTSKEKFDGVLTAETAYGVEVLSNEVKFENGTAKIKLKSLPYEIDSAQIKLVTKKDDKVYYSAVVKILYDRSGIITNQEWQVSKENVELWDYRFDVTNVRTDKDLSGTVMVNNANKSFLIPSIAPGETREVVIPMKIKNVEDIGKIDATVNFDTNESLNVQQEDYMTVVEYAKKAPVIDGKLDTDEWQDNFFTLKLDRESQVYYDGSAKVQYKWAGIEDCNAKFYLKYDLDNFYLGAVVEDDVRDSNYPVDAMWKGDSLQVLVVFDKEATKGTQYGIGLADGIRPAIYRNSQEGNTAGYVGAAATGEYLDGEVAITTSGNKTYYEAKFPWDKIKYDGGSVERGDTLFFSVLVNDADGNTVNNDVRREFWMEYGLSNIGRGKSAPALALKMMLE